MCSTEENISQVYVHVYAYNRADKSIFSTESALRDVHASIGNSFNSNEVAK